MVIWPKLKSVVGWVSVINRYEFTKLDLNLKLICSFDWSTIEGTSGRMFDIHCTESLMLILGLWICRVLSSSSSIISGSIDATFWCKFSGLSGTSRLWQPEEFLGMINI